MAHQFLDRFSVVNNKRVDRFSNEVFQIFFSYSWPGNIRELENVVERAVVLSYGEEIVAADLPSHMTKKGDENGLASPLVMKDVAEKEAIEMTLEKHNYNVNATAQELNIHRSTLYRKIEKFHIILK